VEHVRREARGPVALLVLDRPKALNALDSAMLRALAARCAELAGDGSVRAVVLTGEGRAFAAGADIAEMRGHDALEAERFSRLGHATLAALEALAVPVIAAVNGYALGGGCELALACDWIYASERSRFGQPEVGLGLVPGFGGTTRLVRRVGPAWAKELVLSGEPIDAATALRIGLVQEVVEPGHQLARAVALAETIAAQAPLGVYATLASSRAAIPSAEHAAASRLMPDLKPIMGSADVAEGMRAFMERRAGKFSGR